MFIECLNMTDAVGMHSDDPPSFSLYEGSDDSSPQFFTQIHPTFRVTEITTCFGNMSPGIMKGFSFKLSDPNNSNSGAIELPMLGKEGAPNSNTCETIDMTQGLVKIKTSLDITNRFVNAISYRGYGDVNA